MTVVVDQARKKPAICNLHLLVICTTTVHTTLYLHRLCSEVRERGALFLYYDVASAAGGQVAWLANY